MTGGVNMAREKMTDAERKQLRALQAKEQRIRRHNKEFWREVDSRLDEIMSRYNLVKNNESVETEIVIPSPVINEEN
jgi:choline kinase